MQPIVTVIAGATLIDGRGGAPLHDSVVVVRGDRIAAVGAPEVVPLPDGAERIDARGRFLLPGMIELHSHMFFPTMVAEDLISAILHDGVGEEPAAYGALCAARNLRQALQAGVTTVRDVMALDYLDVALKRAVDEGIVLGPRLFVSGRGICMTGGHGSSAAGFCRVADGPLEVRRAVREQVRAGADLIKILTTHRTHTPEYTQEELDAGVDEAHRLGRRVACHASMLPGTAMAVRAGVDTLEHGTFLDDQTVRRMADQGTVWVPTAYVISTLPERAQAISEDPSVPSGIRRKIRLVLDGSWSASQAELPRSFEKVLAHGVRIGTGTDVVVRDLPYAAVPEEVEALVRFGCTPSQAIQAATRVGAEALGVDDRLGTVTAGKLADLILVDRDPLADVTALKEVSWVMKSGAIVPFLPEYERMAGMAPWSAA